MKKTITTFSSFKRLFNTFEPDFIKSVLAVIWRVIAAVHYFFHPRHQPGDDGQVGKTLGMLLS